MDWSPFLLLIPHAFASSFMHWLVTYLGAVHQRGTVTTEQVQLGIGVRIQL